LRQPARHNFGKHEANHMLAATRTFLDGALPRPFEGGVRGGWGFPLIPVNPIPNMIPKPSLEGRPREG